MQPHLHVLARAQFELPRGVAFEAEALITAVARTSSAFESGHTFKGSNGFPKLLLLQPVFIARARPCLRVFDSDRGMLYATSKLQATVRKWLPARRHRPVSAVLYGGAVVHIASGCLPMFCD